MFESLLLAWYLQLPVIVGGVLHMVVVTRDLWPSLKVPVWQSLFGANKTWRGMLFMPVLTALGACLLYPVDPLLGSGSPFAGHALWLAGAVAGIGYVLAELPNSFIKRRLGIAPGATPEQHKHFFILLDQLDSGIGVALAYVWFLGVSWQVFACFVLSFPLTALVVKRLLYWARLKKSAV
ncbi:MAG: CDP-archaeol synthase [Fluviicoccus sp.]|uniref:CDP-archaeol synthase n=1 Tax=Fluviicoccus sp. TaxID=2003552 RepID=UPI00271E1607|nr:CDP-archaeol synthase [Fluviicoccus sp.]MDO8329066.1 CDP-archaeol synthase [Fluviicoccus sp.]